jgi:hypothetical protein
MGTLTNPEAFIGVVNFQNLGNDKVRRHAIRLFSLEWKFLVVVRMRFGAIGFGAHLVLLGRVCFLTWSTGSVLLAHFNTSRSLEDRYSAEGLVDWLGFAVTWTGTELSICSINRRTDVLPFCHFAAHAVQEFSLTRRAKRVQPKALHITQRERQPGCREHPLQTCKRPTWLDWFLHFGPIL